MKQVMNLQLKDKHAKELFSMQAVLEQEYLFIHGPAEYPQVKTLKSKSHKKYYTTYKLGKKKKKESRAF